MRLPWDVPVRLSLLILCGIVLTATSCADDLERAPVAFVEGGDRARGRELLDTYGCTSCHTIPGIRGADANIGPPLTDWGERWYIAGALVNEPDNLITWIQAPQSVEPGTAMPDMGVTTGEARDMAAYLYTLVDGEYDATPAEEIPQATPVDVQPDVTPTEEQVDATPVDATPDATPADAEEDAGAESLIAMGESVYDDNCARCHGSQGTGTAGYPALAGNDFVTGDPDPVIETVVQGRGAMPAFGNELDNEQIAAVVSYIRNTWGNDATVVGPEDVEAAR